MGVRPGLPATIVPERRTQGTIGRGAYKPTRARGPDKPTRARRLRNMLCVSWGQGARMERGEIATT
jgi:hypothetical protein